MSTSFAMAAPSYDGSCVLELPNGWVNAWKLEQALIRCGGLLCAGAPKVTIRIPTNCSLMIDVITRLLSLCNQLIAATCRLCLDFVGGANSKAMGYLSRMGFFENLASEVEVLPGRPAYSGAEIYRGANRGLVEIARFNSHNGPDRGLPSRLAEAVERACGSRADNTEIGQTIFKIFGELIDNVPQHSRSNLDSFAALQTYPRGDKLTVTVSDSGVGILHTLREGLKAKGSNLTALKDVDLIVETFRDGLSRRDDDKSGNGLKESARAAIKFGADLDLRLPQQHILLKPADGVYRPITAYCREGLPLIWGTHIAFSLALS